MDLAVIVVQFVGLVGMTGFLGISASSLAISLTLEVSKKIVKILLLPLTKK